MKAGLKGQARGVNEPDAVSRARRPHGAVDVKKKPSTYAAQPKGHDVEQTRFQAI